MAKETEDQSEAFRGEVRRLLLGGRSGALSTTMRGRAGGPYGSLVTYAPDVDGSPIFLFSTLSDHTGNLMKDARASLLVEESSRRKNPQTGPRATFMGTVKPTKNPRHRRRFLARHPDAAFYAGFGDFGFYVMTVDRVHLVGGFARARWFKWADVQAPAKAVKAVQAAEQDIVAHMNADHGEALDLYVAKLLRRKGRGWQAVGCDPWGLDIMRNGGFARVPFDEIAADAGRVRACLMALAAKARGWR
ncbi:MAG: DUF2470 domain-containing protein [Rhodospirillaceae bacterium]